MTFVQTQNMGDVLKREMLQIIFDDARNSPRSTQAALGPSELGNPCTRRLAYRLLDHPKTNEGSGFGDGWSAQVGTAIHAHLADVFAKHEGFEVEKRVVIPGMAKGGSVDLFITGRGIVLDWKTTGPSGLKKYIKDGATKQQLVQVNLYAYGKKLAGADVQQVALAFLPTSGSLSDAHFEVHPYNEQMALDALARQDSIYSLLVSLDLEANPQHWDLMPTHADRMCSYCPWYLPGSTNSSAGCAGDVSKNSKGE